MAGTALWILAVNQAIYREWNVKLRLREGTTSGNCPLPTLVIVLAVATVQFQGYATIRSVPALVATAFPLTLAAHSALAVCRTTVGATLDGAVLAIPTGDTQTRSVLALTVLVATTVAEFRVAVLATPLRITGAGIALTATMLATIEVAQLLGAVIATPLGLARAGLGVQVEGTVARAVGQALQGILIHGGTVCSLPALFADAGAVGTEAMSRAIGMGTVDCEEKRGNSSVKFSLMTDERKTVEILEIC